MAKHDLQQTEHLRGDDARCSIPVFLIVCAPFTILAVGYHFAQGYHQSTTITEMLQVLLLLYAASSMTSWLFHLIGLPFMLGGFLTGVILRHCFCVTVVQTSTDEPLNMLRSVSLAVLSLYISVSLDFFTLTKIKRTVLALSTLPFILELFLITTTLYSLTHLQLSFTSSAVIGSTLNVISAPTVLAIAAYHTTYMHAISKKTLCLISVAACLEEIIGTSVLSLTQQYHISIETERGMSATLTEVINILLYGPIGAVAGMAIAYIWAYSTTLVIARRAKFSWKIMTCQSIHLTSGAVFLVLFATIFKLPLAITSGCLLLGCIVSSAWKEVNEDIAVLRNTLALLWTVLCPLYFGLLGNHMTLDVFDIQPQVITKCVATVILIISFASRFSTTLFITRLSRLPVEDCLFAGFTTVSKALIPWKLSQYALLQSLTDTAVLAITQLSVITHLLFTMISVYMASMVGLTTPTKRTVSSFISTSPQAFRSDKDIAGLKSSKGELLKEDVC